MATVSYRLIRSDRKTVSLRITVDGKLEVRAPRYLSDARIREFVMSKERWIQKHMQEKTLQTPYTAEELKALTNRARCVVPQRVAHYASLVGVTYGRITIRSQKTRWGSCSTKGNLNFNCLLMLTPSEVLDYVVIHELCHRKEMNHSPCFWKEVGRLCPDYKAHRKWLKKNGNDLISRLP